MEHQVALALHPGSNPVTSDDVGPLLTLDMHEAVRRQSLEGYLQGMRLLIWRAPIYGPNATMKRGIFVSYLLGYLLGLVVKLLMS